MTSPDSFRPVFKILRPIKIVFDTLPDGLKCVVADNPNTGKPANLADEILFRQHNRLEGGNVSRRIPDTWEVFKGGK